MGKKSFQRIILGLLAITSLMISACSTGSDDDSPPTHYTVTFYSSVDAGADTTSVTVPVRGQIDSEDFPDAFAVDPGDGRVFLEWSIYPTGKGAIVDEDSIITSSMSLYPIWGYEITDLREINFIGLDAAYKLIADVDMPGLIWSPIGVGTTNSFRGVLYGDGHKITGIMLSPDNYAGIFGVLNNAYIRDLHIGLNSATIMSIGVTVRAGGLAGYASNGTVINNVSVSGDMNMDITGDGYIGLIVGQLEDSVINNSFTTGNLTVTTPYSIYAGGITGYIYGGTVDSNYVLGTITANTASGTPEVSGYAGGIAGYAYAGSVISKNVVVSPSVSSANSGWIAGNSSGTQFSSNYYQNANAQTSAINDKDGASVAVVDAAFFRSIGWDYNNAWADPNQSRIYFYPVAKRGNAATWVNVDFDTASDISTYQVVYDLLTDISSVPSTSSDFLLWDSFQDGRGDFVNNVKTIFDIYVYGIEGRKISTAEELADMTQQLGDGDTYNYMLVADIDLSNYGTWQPVGEAADPFISTFYGNGHTISGINLADTANTGLFGYLENAYIRDLTLNAATLYSTPAIQIRNAGALAGVISSGTYINNITVTGSINIATSAGALNLGGIAGENRTNIENSLVSAAIYGAGSAGDPNVGGIAGVNNGSIISRSVSTGTIEASRSGSGALVAHAGGIVGLNQSGMITTSYSTGAITAGNASTSETSTASAGGVAGYNYGDIFATYSTGNISATTLGTTVWPFAEHRANAGGIAGQSEGVVSVSYSSGAVYSSSYDYPHSAGIVADMRGTISRVYRSVGANEALTATGSWLGNDLYSGRIIGNINDWAAFPIVNYNYANSNMTINGSYRADADKEGTGKSLRDLGLQQTYEDLNIVAITGAEMLQWDFMNTWKTDGQSLPTFIWQN